MLIFGQYQHKLNVFFRLWAERQRVLPTGTLQIVRVSRKDEGVYRCSVVSPVTGQRQDAPNTYQLKVVTGM
jgi:hypothetical protein